MADDLRSQLAELQTALGDLSPITAEIGEIVLSSVDRNFSESGRFGNDNIFGGGSQHWIPSRRAKQQSGETLVDTGQLAASITVRSDRNSITIGTNKVYAAIHQFGGLAGSSHHPVPARPFLVIQDQDLLDIQAVVLEYYSKLLT